MWILNFILYLVLFDFLELTIQATNLCDVCGKFPKHISNEPVKTIRLNQKSRSLIYLGDEPTHAPWAIFIKIGRSECSGSLIGFQSAISAAHCWAHFRNNEPEQLALITTVYAGSIKKDITNFIKLEVKAVYLRSDFIEEDGKDEHTNTFNDLAVIIFKDPIPNDSRLVPLCLGINVKDSRHKSDEYYETENVDHDWQINDEVIVQGYGTINCYRKFKDELLQPSDSLKEARLPVEYYNVCEEMQGNKCTPSQFAMGRSDSGSVICPGDSGSTIIKNATLNGELRAFLVGCVAWGGPGDGQDNEPLMATRLWSFFDWIESKTNEPICYPNIEKLNERKSTNSWTTFVDGFFDYLKSFYNNFIPFLSSISGLSKSNQTDQSNQLNQSTQPIQLNELNESIQIIQSNELNQSDQPIQSNQKFRKIQKKI